MKETILENLRSLKSLKMDGDKEKALLHSALISFEAHLLAVNNSKVMEQHKKRSADFEKVIESDDPVSEYNKLNVGPRA